MVIGTAGAGFTMNAVTPPPVWNEDVFYQYGYAVVEAVNASFLTWTWINSGTDDVYVRMIVTQDGKPWVLPSSSSSPSSSSNSPNYGLLIALPIVLGSALAAGLAYYFFYHRGHRGASKAELQTKLITSASSSSSSAYSSHDPIASEDDSSVHASR